MRHWLILGGLLSFGFLAGVGGAVSHDFGVVRCDAPVDRCAAAAALTLAPDAEALCRSAASPTDDSSIERRFSRAMQRYNKQGKVVAREVLMGQLERKTCDRSFARPSSQELNAEQVYARLKPSTVLVGSIYNCGRCSRWHTGLASGFVVGSDGVIATNHHVVESDRKDALGVMLADGRVFPVKEVLAANEAADVALVKIDVKGLIALPLRVDAPVGARVYVLGHPDGQYFSFSEGLIARYLRLRVKAGVRPRRMAITADFAKGSSGSPVVDASGAVVGIVSSTRSIYYNDVKGDPRNLQMVLKHCVTGADVAALVADSASAKPKIEAKPARRPQPRLY